MPKEPLIRDRTRRALAGASAAVLLLVGLAVVPSSAVEHGTTTAAPLAADPPAQRRGEEPSGVAPLGAPPKPTAPCAWWYGIGEPPTYADLDLAARRYDLVVLNATETAAMRRLRRLNPKIKVLVYKDFSSTRDYHGAVVGGHDAPLLPSGIGYVDAERRHPEWFALDTADRRIEWAGYPRHWQMAVWDAGYQRAWAEAVTAEVVREGWDGVLADNDFSSLKYYSKAVLKGTADTAATDRSIRDGMDRFLEVAGSALHKAGKMLIPNVSESQLTPGRWSAHSRFDGAMEENFGLRGTGGDGELVTFQGNEFKELRAQAALGESWLLLVTKTHGHREERVGYATAALLAGPYTCWHGARTNDYQDPDWSVYQDTDLGEAVETANRLPGGTWTRRFTHGWVAVNPTGKPVRVDLPAGLVGVDGTPAPPSTELAATDALVLLKPGPPVTTPAATPPTTAPTTTAEPITTSPGPTAPKPTTTLPAPVTTTPVTTTPPATTDPTTPPVTTPPPVGPARIARAR
ncbi:putative glycoside hydrolase family 15 protein [Actinosynnema sp. NPDC023587]|uniref:putative glycoside hydrolase family 15 protein n=1 Tax=Actinosynnema sp. NPDC023587 TaxID=3154695 RepID=UPI00340B08BE